MLSSDISLQQISELLDEKLKPIYKELSVHRMILDSHSEILESHSEVLRSHSQILQLHSELLQKHSKMLTSQSKSLKSLKKDQSTMLEMLDSEQMDQRKRLHEVEKRLGLPSAA